MQCSALSAVQCSALSAVQCNISKMFASDRESLRCDSMNALKLVFTEKNISLATMTPFYLNIFHMYSVLPGRP